MARPLIYGPRAEADFLALIDYIAQRNPEAVRRFGGQLLDRVDALEEHPHLGRAMRGCPGVRILSHPPYLIFYRVHDEPRRVEILRFWHSARDPKTLRFD